MPHGNPRTSACILLSLLVAAGCRGTLQDDTHSYPAEPRPLGSIVDQVMQQQEENAEPAKFVIYQHEFELNKPEWEYRLNKTYSGIPRGFRLSPNGADHVRRIAELIRRGADYPVVVERNQTSVDHTTQHRYSVHYGDETDTARRDIVVRTLQHLGIVDAEARVVVAPAFSEGLHSTEAAASWSRTHRTISTGSAGTSGSGGGLGGGSGGGF